VFDLPRGRAGEEEILGAFVRRDVKVSAAEEVSLPGCTVWLCAKVLTSPQGVIALKLMHFSECFTMD
jgi:hypothetical protein